MTTPGFEGIPLSPEESAGHNLDLLEDVLRQAGGEVYSDEAFCSIGAVSIDGVMDAISLGVSTDKIEVFDQSEDGFFIGLIRD